MTGKRTCPNCGKRVDLVDSFCGKCGSPLPKGIGDQRATQTELSTRSITSYSSISSPTRETYQTSISLVKPGKRLHWYTPPKRSRPAYHPIEWFFWIGWGIFVLIGFIFVAFKWLLREIFYYFFWICGGTPERLEKRRKQKKKEL